MGPRLSSKQIIIAGFAGVILLVAGLIAIGLTRLAEINDQMDEIANRAYKRAEAVFTMRVVARDRLVGLQSMFFITDPFDRDEERIRYSAEAVNFINARDMLFSLGLSPKEKGIWNDAREMIQVDELLHQEALDLIFSDRFPEASALIRQKIIPLENNLRDKLGELLDIERNSMDKRLHEASLRYRQTFILMMLLGMGTLNGTIATAIYEVRRSARTEALLIREKHHAEEAAEKLEWAATHDALTGLPNRRLFEWELSSMVNRVPKEGKAHVLVYIDLDNFKQVNDTGGHELGDTLLVAVTKRMRDAVRSADTLARLGGDEFGLLLPNCGIDEAQVLVSRIQQNVESYSVAHEDTALSVGMSAGIIPINAKADNIPELLRRADMACYQSKQSRRNKG